MYEKEDDNVILLYHNYFAIFLSFSPEYPCLIPLHFIAQSAYLAPSRWSTVQGYVMVRVGGMFYFCSSPFLLRALSSYNPVRNPPLHLINKQWNSFSHTPESVFLQLAVNMQIREPTFPFRVNILPLMRAVASKCFWDCSWMELHVREAATYHPVTVNLSADGKETAGLSSWLYMCGQFVWLHTI